MSKTISAPEIGHILQKLYDSGLSYRIECYPNKGFAWAMTKNDPLFLQETVRPGDFNVIENKPGKDRTELTLDWTEHGISETFEAAVWELCKAVVNNFPGDADMEWLKEYLIEKNAEANQI